MKTMQSAPLLAGGHRFLLTKAVCVFAAKPRRARPSARALQGGAWLFALVSLFLHPGTLAAQSAGRSAIPVILISVDTLRADHLSCYGYRRIRTPAIDGLSQGGTQFAEASSQVPLTLPSHVSLFTSTYPFTNGVEENGELLPAGAVTLAAALKAHGWQTAAFVGGFVLDRRFGLDQGFGVYDSPFRLNGYAGHDSGDIKRPGGEVLRSATKWLKSNSNQSFFLFIHLYDLHTPYNLPPSWHSAYPGSGYDFELQYVDRNLRDFLKVLKGADLYQRSLIVLTADHGEGLGDHGEMTHGYFIYQSTLRVPLIFHWPIGYRSFRSQVQSPAALLDVAPTILQFLGVPAPPQFEGKSLLRAAEGKPPGASRPVHSESHYAQAHFGFSALRCIRSGTYKYIDAPKPELYDLEKDPGESQNLWESHRSLALALRERLLALEAQYHPAQRADSRKVPADVVARLASLGYMALAQPVNGAHGPGKDPKDGLAEYKEYGRAIQLANAGELAQSNQLLERLIALNPGLLDARNRLGLNLQAEKRYGEAASQFRQMLKADPLNALAHFNLAVSEFALGQLDEAAKDLKAALAIEPYYTRAGDLLGTIRLKQGDATRARSEFHAVLQTDAGDYTALYDLGVLNAMEGHWRRAVERLRAALKTGPNSAEAHNALGSAYLRQGNFTGAQSEFTKAISLNPRFAEAHFNLGLTFEALKHPGQAAGQFRQALALNPALTPAAKALDRLQTQSQAHP
jgi:choline-sulfatase